MGRGLTSRTGEAFDLSQTALKVLLREPVKKAVHEALEEERSSQVESTTDEESTGLNRSTMLLSVLGIAAVLFVVRRWTGGRSQSGWSGDTAEEEVSESTTGPNTASTGSKT